MRRLLVALVAVGALAAPAAAEPVPAGPDHEPRLLLPGRFSGLERPVHVIGAGDQARLFVVEQGGTIRTIVLDDIGGVLQDEPYLDISDRVGCSGGLLSVAPSPTFVEDGYLYVQYDGVDCDVVISRFSSNDDGADAASEEVLLRLDPLRPGSNGHTGGQLAFDPDGFLFAAIGDGSSENDSEAQAQDPESYFGKLLRFDVDTDDPPTIWASGLRNPWRFSFDRETGDLWIADVGEAEREEINLAPAGTPAGRNYGWPIMEGTRCFAAATCDADGLTLPIAEYTTGADCSITGGFVYRGADLEALLGAYLFGDLCSGHVWAMRQVGGEWRRDVVADLDITLVSFGEDDFGELLVVDHEGELGWLGMYAEGRPLVGVDRIAGPSRYGTAGFLAEDRFEPGGVVYVVTGETFPDALAAAPAAAVDDAPVLLTTSHELQRDADNAIRRLDPTSIVVVGGSGAVSDAVVAELAELTTGDVVRVAGDSRYATAAAISARSFPTLPARRSVVLLASGEGFADALGGAAAAAWGDSVPLLLTARDSLPDATSAELERLAPDAVLVLGGTGAVSDAVLEAVEALGPEVERLAGATRYGTAIEVATRVFAAHPEAEIPEVVLATGTGFADGLVAGALGIPLLLLPGDGAVGAEILDGFRALGARELLVMGGSGAITDDQIRTVARAR